MNQISIIDDRYVLGDLLGSGGMARVFLAHDELLNRDVALKVLRDEYVQNGEFVERFRREAQSAATLNHPNVVSIYDCCCSEDGMHYIAMECVSGGTLKDRIGNVGPLGSDVAAELGSEVAEALEFAHERGLIHRDVKSQNILLTTSGEVKVADFGIARAAAATAISQTGLILGTASYMSPEQIMDKRVGPASDLYSLGVVLYEMLTGELPFEAETLVAICMKHVNELPRPPKEANPEVPEGMNTIVLKLLSKKPENRYGSAAELAEDLRRVRNGLSPLALRPVTADLETTRIYRQTNGPVPSATTVPHSAVRRRRRAKLPRVSALTFLLVALLGGIGWNLSGHAEGLDLASIIEGLRQAPVSSPQAEASEVPEDAGQPVDTETASAQDLTQADVPSNKASMNTSAGQDPSGIAVQPSTALVSDVIPESQLTTQQALEQPASTQSEPTQPQSRESKDTQDAPAQQAQVQVFSSQTSGGKGQNHNASNIKIEQRGGQGKNSKGSPNKR